MFPDSFSTSRLKFERFHRKNITPNELYGLISQNSPTIEEETEYLPWNPVQTLKDAADRIDMYEEKWDTSERAEWLISLNDTMEGGDVLIGSTGLICRWDKDLAILAIWLRKPFWGNGYSGERADALLNIAFEILDFEMVAIPLHSQNSKSYKAVEKYVKRHGGKYEGLLRNHGGRYEEPVDHHRFSISQVEYRNSTTSTETVSE